jgi:PAS domain S-box-containing protein
MQGKEIANRYKLVKQKFQDKLCTVYDAVDRIESRPVTLKLFSEEVKRRSLERRLRFRREVERVSEASHPNLLKIFESGEHEGCDYLVTEYVNGAHPLSDRLKHTPEADEAVKIMLQACSGLGAAHKKGIIHQSLNPSSILVFQNGDRQEVKLTDFGVVLLLDLAGIKKEDEIVRTFGYMSPEATGILRKPIDERSDIYSLGIIFYNLLTGRLPYDGKDTSTLIHQHIAQKPPLPTKINPSIPAVIEKIVLRLISKEPLDRYQTALGLYVDLQEYVRRKAKGETLNFEIARSDRLKELTYMTRLIGRDREFEELKAAVDRSKEGRGSLCFVHGGTGVGKSRLIDELRGYVYGLRGVFVGGKGSQYDVTTPYKVFSEALDAYVEKLKRVSAEERQATVERIKESVGELGRELIKIVPSISDVIGEQPELAELDPEKERIRFLITVTSFIRGLGTQDSPLIIFLDDLQWVDEGSIELLERLSESTSGHPVVLIASFRDKEVDRNHPLMMTFERLKEKDISLIDIPVRPFGIEDTGRIISDILLEEEADVIPLAKELHQRTNGNVFFVLEMLRSLVEQGVVLLEDNKYRYDLAALKKAVIPSDIVEMVIKRLEDISEENQKILSCASVMGKEINLEFLSDLTHMPDEHVLDILEEGIENQILLRDITRKDAVGFVHERIREAFYKKLTEAQRLLLYGQIGNLLEEQNRDNPEPVLYDLAYYFAQAGIEDKTLLYSLAAGKKAQNAHAHDQAILFYGQAKEILEKQEKTSTDEYVDLLENLGLAYKTSGKFEEALEVLETCEKLIPKEDMLRRAEVLSKAGDTLWEKGEGEKATKLMRDALKSLGVKLPVNMPGVVTGLLKESLIQGLHTLFPGLFVRKEYRHDQKKSVIVRLLLRMAYFYYFTDLLRTLHLGMKYLNIGERIGPSILLSRVYSTHTVIWAGVPFAAFRAKRDALLGLKIAQDLQDKGVQGSAYGYYAVSTYSNRDVKEAHEYALKSINILKGIGEYWDLGMGLYYRPACGVLLGMNFKTLLQEVEEMIQIALSSHSLQALGWGRYHKARLLALIGDELFTSEGIQSGEEGVRTMEQVKDRATCLQGRSYLAFAHLRAGNYDKAVEITEQVISHYLKDSNAASFIHDVFPISAQVYLDCVRYNKNLSEDQKKQYLKKAKRLCKVSSVMQRFFPYLRSYSYQVNGTYQWLIGNKKRAVEIWEQGIAYIGEKNEDTYRLASIFLEEASFLLKDRPGDKKAQEYLIEAKEIFTQVGAKLDLKRSNELLTSISPEAEAVGAREVLTTTRHLESLLSVTKAIGSIFVLEDLLEKIVEQAMKVTGAERGFLLLYDEKDNTLKQKVAKGIEKELATTPFSYENHKLSLNLVRETEKTGEGLFAGEQRTTYPQISRELKEYKVREAMCIPLRAKEKPLGMIYLDNRMTGGTFGEEELELMKSFAVQASISIENAYLVRDLVEQERLKQETETRFRTLFNESRDAIYIVTKEGNFFDFNQSMQDLFGYTREEMLKLNIKDLYADTSEQNRFQEAMGEMVSVRNFEIKFCKKDRTEIFCLVTSTARKDEEGNILGYHGIIHDITERKKLEQQLLQAQKMEAIGQLAGGIAHDFNNILTVIIGYANLLQMGTDRNGRLKDKATQILNAAQRAANLTHALLTFSRKQIISPKAANLNETIKVLGNLLFRLIGEDIDFSIQLAEKDLIVMADSTQIDQLLMNLVTNARDAMPGGGRLTITTDLVNFDDEFMTAYGFGRPGAYALIAVQDTGHGMDSRTRERIFEPFFTTKEAGKGTGLGLAMVYGIIKQHNGYINVYSEPGKGTTFKIYLPLIKSRVDDKGLPDLSAIQMGSETILMAEDDIQVRGLTRKILEKAGYRILEAVDGADAVKLFNENRDTIQLLLLDVIMPKMNGKECYDEIRKTKPDIKTIYISGYTADIIQKKGIVTEHLDLILKPVLPNELLKKVREVLDRSKAAHA